MKKYVLPLLIVTLFAGSDIGFLYIGGGLLVVPNLCTTNTANPTHARFCDQVKVTFFDHQASTVNQTLVSQGWKPDCEFGCHGIHYVYDTHNKITNNGVGFLQDQTLGITPSATAYANWIALTTDTATPAYTDTTCTSEITTNGLQRAAGTLVKGTPAAGSSVSTNTKTFTATGTFTAVDKACLFTASSSGTLVADTLFSAVNMVNGDQLTINRQMTLTY